MSIAATRITTLLLAVGLAATLVGCTSPSTDDDPERVSAYDACQEFVTPQFENPSTVVWPKDGWTAKKQISTWDVTATVTSREDNEAVITTLVTCSLTGTTDAWTLASFNLALQ